MRNLFYAMAAKPFRLKGIRVIAKQNLRWQ